MRPRPAAHGATSLRPLAVLRGPLAGWTLTVIAIVLVEVLSRTVLRVPSLTVLLAVVAFAAFLYGLRPGLLSAALVSLYGVYYFSIPDQPFRYTVDGVVRTTLLPLTAAGVALAVGVLRGAVRAREADIRRQLEFSRAIDLSLAEGVYAIDREGRVTFVNPAAERLLGWTEAELRGRIMHDAIHHHRPDGTPYPREECEGLQVFDLGIPIRTENDTFFRKDGTSFPVAYSSAPIRMERQLVGAVVAFQDITARRRAEEDLRDSRNQLEVILQGVADGITAQDGTGVLRFANHAAARMLCYPSAQALLAAPLAAVMRRFELLDEEGRPFPADRLPGRLALRGQVEPETVVRFRETATGQERWSLVKATPVKDEGGEIRLAINIFRDITERRRTEEALRESEAKLRLITERIPAYGWVTDRKMRITSTFGTGLAQQSLDPGTFVGKTVPELRGETAEATDAHRRALGGEHSSYLLRLNGRDLEARVEPLRDGSGHLIGSLGLAVDVTEQRQRERRLDVQSKVGRVLAAAGDLGEAAPAVLQAIGEYMGWDYGALWTVDRGHNVLRCAAAWHETEPGLTEFIAATRGAAFAPGVGLPGQVWREGRARWILDVVNEGTFPRLRLAAAIGLRSGLGLPIVLDGQIVGVLEFLTREARGEDEEVLAVLGGLAGQIGQFVERKRAEEGLRLSEERYRSAFAESAIGHALATLDGRLSRINHAFCSIAGRGETELLTTDFATIVHPEERERLDQRVARLAAGERSHFQSEQRFLREDGRAVPVLCDVAAVHDAQGRPQSLTILVQDITQRRLAQAALQARAQQQAAVAQLGQRALATPDLTAVFDEAVALVAATLRVEYAKVLELLPEGDTLLLRAGIGWRAGLVGRATVGAGTDSQAGYTLLANGPVIVEDLREEARFSGPPLLHDHGVVSGLSVAITGRGRPFGVLGAHTTRSRTFTADDCYFVQAIANVLAMALERRDFERRLADEEVASRASRDEVARLAELDRLRRDFIASVSHELRTPLASLGLAANLIAPLSEGQFDPDREEAAGVMRRNIERLTRYVDDLLLVNQLDAGVLRLDRRPLDLRDTVAGAVAAIGPLLEEKAQEVALDLAEPLPVFGDEYRLEQVLINLLGNAHRHTPAGTRVVVAGRVADGEVQLMVRDDGPGIPEAHLERIFERFQRLGKQGGGSGLGLVVARNIVALHEGRLWAESPSGKGATFHVALPAIASGMESGGGT